MHSNNRRPATRTGQIQGRKPAVTFGLIGIITILLLIVGIGNLAVTAQEPGQWSPDERVPDYLDDTFPPFLLAGQNRTVHAFANQWVGDDNAQMAIVYRQWSLDGGWTTPVDILLSPVGEAHINGAFLDQTGTMHVMFWGGEARAANIYYARAPAASADRAPAWSAPELVGEGALFPPAAALAGDDDGNLIIIYSGNMAGNGVYEFHSSDAGATWSEPRSIFLTYDPELTPFSLHLSMGRDGQVHAVWNVVTATGADMSAHYARLDVARQEWSEPILLEERIEEEGFFGPSFPAIVDTGDEVVVMYNSGNPVIGGPVPAGRPVQRVRRSDDGGQTWREPTGPFPHHLGRSGEHSLVVDSNQVVHALFMQRIETLAEGQPTVIDGPWHSELRGGLWREPDPFPTTWSPHDIRAVISQGNVLLVTWRADPGVGQHGVWYSYTTLDAPELPVVPLPTVLATPTAIPPPTATPVIPTSTPSPGPVVARQGGDPSGFINNPAGPFIFGIVPVILLLAGIVVLRQWTHYRRS